MVSQVFKIRSLCELIAEYSSYDLSFMNESRVNKKNKYFVPGNPVHKRFVRDEFVLYGYNKYIEVLRQETQELQALHQIKLNLSMTSQLMTGGTFFKKVVARMNRSCNLQRAIVYQQAKVSLIHCLMEQEWSVYDIVQRELYTYFYGHIRYNFGRHYCCKPVTARHATELQLR